MDLHAIGIPLTFLILASLGLWFVILGKGYWWAKLGFITIVLYFSLALWNSLSSLSGWATDTKLPPKFVVHWTLVSEPSKINPKEVGGIFFWATEINEENMPKKEEINYFLQPFAAKKADTEPRVYRLPYSEKLHKDLQSVMQKIRQGKTVVGKGKTPGEAGEEGEGKGKGKGKGQGNGQGNGKGKGKNGRGGSMSQEQEFMFYDLPPFKMPEKDPQE